MNVYNIFNIIFKHKKKIVWIFFSIVIAVVAGTFLMKPIYEAKATLLVKMWKEDESRPGMEPSNDSYRLSLSQEEMVNTEIQILTGADLAKNVIQLMKLETIYPDLLSVKTNDLNPMGLAVQIFEENLSVSGVRKSNVIALTFRHSDPRIAAKALNLLVEKFKEKHLALHSDPQSSFIGSQFTSFENKLKGLEKDLQAFQQNNRVYSLEEQRSLLLKQRMDLDTTYKVASNNVSELKSKIVAIKAQLKEISSSSARYTPSDRDKIITDAKSKLLELQLKEQELSRKYTDSNRLVINARKEVQLVNQFLKDQEEGITGKVKTGNPVYQSMETDLFRAEGELKSQIARADAVKSQVTQLDKEIALLDMNENKLQNLKREIAINEKNYRAYADRQEEARISEAMNRLKLSNISVIENASIPIQPIKPNKKLNIAVGFILAVSSALVCAYVSENIAQTFSDPESLEKYLGLPVLLTVPVKEV